ncbi:MAG: ATP-binding cassette domain-containing protein [Microcella sp.]|uniref:sulfate/molybdate ABC transporter ATP-binding protein n=1 Tax=Microcella sp. TaxID=1913979 RepID=UPI003315A549
MSAADASLPPGSLEAALLVNRGGFVLDVSLAVRAGHPLALIGPNGAGKSTALLAIAGALALDGGHVRLGDRVLADTAEGIDRPAADRRVGVVFQGYALFPHLTVRENIAFGPRAQGRGRAAARRAAEEWIARMGLTELAERVPGQLSGGQAQKVALARSLAADPAALVLDEPLSALDVEVRAAVRADLSAHIRAFGGATIVVAHDRDDVAALADRVLALEGGRVVQRGTLAELAAAPATEFVRRFTSG